MRLEALFYVGLRISLFGGDAHALGGERDLCLVEMLDEVAQDL